MIHRFSLILAAGLLAPPGRAEAEEAADLAIRAREVMKTHCVRCHNGPGSISTYDFDVMKYETLVKPKVGEPVVVGHSLVKSDLWDAVQKRMPQKGSPELASFGDAERLVLKKWIESGAPPFPANPRRPFVSLKGVLTAIRVHLAQAPPEDRPFLRYFSLAHVHNNYPAFADDDLRYLRAALSKTVNSLSWKPRLVVPEAVDKDGTVYAIDIRAVGWDRGELWSKVLDAYPYGLKYGTHPDTKLKELDAEIVRETKTDLPWVRADWFVATAGRPPLYHDLLRLPKNAKQLEEQLGIDIPENFRKDTLARAGFPKSGVSGQNRMVERHDSPHGAYWKSYDFLPENGRANLVRFPLGPSFERNPHIDQAFKQDGGEIIFNLPNGLQGYLLVNGKDERIDAGPIDVVSDDKRVSGTPAIVNGISCHACHKHGMFDFEDTIREGSAVFGDAADKVKRLYRDQKSMNDLVAADRQKFLGALEKAIGPFLKAGADKETPITKFKEPVTEVVVGYRRGYLDLATVAHELFLEDPNELLQKVGAKRLKQLGLESLAKPGGLVARYQWDAVDGVSLMQELARELKFTPLR